MQEDTKKIVNMLTKGCLIALRAVRVSGEEYPEDCEYVEALEALRESLLHEIDRVEYPDQES